MKRLGGIITVLLVVFCAGTVISCAGTKNAIVKDSKKGNNTSKNPTENSTDSLSSPMQDSVDNTDDAVKVNVDELTQSLNQTEKILPEAFLETESFMAQMFDIPGVLSAKEIAAEESEIESLANQEEEIACGKDDSLGNGGSVLFTLQRAEELKNGESLPEESLSDEDFAEADIFQIERPTMSVLEERLLGYNGNSDLDNALDEDVIKVEPSAFTFENYETELAVLPAISVEPIKPEATIQEDAYLVQIISLPKIAEEIVSESQETVVLDEVVLGDESQVTENVLVSEPKPLEIALGNSVTPFGLPESFLSPLANPDMVVQSMNNKEEDTNVLPKVEKQQEIVLPTIPEVIFASKKSEEQNIALDEILAENKIEIPANTGEKMSASEKKSELKVAVVYPQVGEAEELEEVADFEMKPDFVFPEEKISGLENQETIIRMQGDGWRVDSVNHYAMKLLERKTGKDGNTIFRIKNGNAGKEQIKFTRYNEDENRQEIQVYSIDIKPVLLTAENNKKNSPKAKKEKKSKAAEDYRRTLADHLYADENFSQACVYYKKLIDENIVDSELLYKAAHSMMKAGNTDTALEYYQRNLSEEGNPFYDDAIIEYILLLKDQKEFDKAINVVYERGLSKGVSDDCTQKLYRTLGDLFFNVKNYTEAIRTYKTVLSLYPAGNGEDKAMFYLAYALELQENPEFKEAQRFYRELLNVYPESQYVNLSRSRIGFIDRHYIKVN